MSSIQFIVWDSDAGCAVLFDINGQIAGTDYYADSEDAAIRALQDGASVERISLPSAVIEAAGDWLTG